MGFRSKRVGPVDRAVADLEHQIQTLERQIHQIDTTGRVEQKSNVGQGVADFIREALLPPSKRKTAPTRRERYDLFDLPASPLEEMQIDHAPAFTPEPPGDVGVVTRIHPVGDADKRLAHYLSAGTFRGQKPVLKHVQRRNQKQFFMWMGLAVAVLCLFYFIVR